MLLRSLPPAVRTRGVTAVLGPTNTGKTHYALERMTAHASGMIGLPLRLLAREVYAKLVARVGEGAVALVTGEEKIKPAHPRFWVSTVEAMPRDLSVEFVAVDEVQLAADPDRGHVFTDRLLNQRGRSETLLIGSATMRPLIEQLMPGVHVVTRPRLSQLSFAGEKKLTRLKARTAIVAFSADEVYAVAELLRRQKGGAAVVMGSLSPRTRNAQVDLFQAGDVDYLVATDAIGMGLNLDVEQVAFASDRKFDGHRFRRLTPAEFGQIAGRAGRHMRDGLFGSTGRCPAFEPELVEMIENHQFEPVRQLHWRNPDLDFRSIGALKASLAVQPTEPGLVKAPQADDEIALDIVSTEPDVREKTTGRALVELLWDACQVPDYRKVSPTIHAELVSTLYGYLREKGRIPDDWFQRQIHQLDRTEGDIDTLSNRIAQIRTWTFVANRPDWLAQPEHWQGVTRQVEDRLSDALHERLASRFVDRRTSMLMRRLRENTMLEAEVTATGDVLVEGQHVGTLSGFVFLADANASATEAKALNAAAQKALTLELEARAARLSLAGDEAFVLAQDGLLRWGGEPVARIVAGEKLLAPRLRVIADDSLSPAAREQIEGRLELWLKAHLTRHLGPLLILEDAPDLAGIARGIGFQIAEALGVLDRSRVANDVKTLDQEARGALRKHGVRFGAYHLYLPLLLKPAPRALAAQLWSLKHGGLEQKGRDDIAQLALSGRTSIPADRSVSRDLYRAAGFHVAGERALRVDILERLADLIRAAITYRPGVTVGEPPPGAADGDGFVVTGGMTSLVGASGPDFASVLKALGYVSSTRPGPAITVPILKPAPTEPVSAVQVVVLPSVQIATPEPAEAPAKEALAPAVTAGEEAEPAPAAAPPLQNEAPDVAITEGAVTEAAADAADSGLTVGEAAGAAAGDAPALTEVAPDIAAPEALPSEPAEATVAPVVSEIEIWRPFRHQQARGPRPARRGAEAAGDGAPREGAPRKPWRGADRGQVPGMGERPAGPPRERPFGQREGERAGPREAGGEAAGGGWRNKGGRDGQPWRGGRGPGGDTRPGRAFGAPPLAEGREGAADAPAPAMPADAAAGAAPVRDPQPAAMGGRERPGRGPDRSGPRPERRGEKGGAPQEFRAPKPDRQPDPDSPFAKLAALKAQMEAQGKR